MGEVTVIGFAGRMGVGKTTTAVEVKTEMERVGYQGKVFAFATHLKETAKFLFMLDDTHVYTTKGKEEYIPWLNCTVRHLLQTLGTEFVRNMIRKDFWVAVLRRKIDQYQDETDGFVFVDDIRFEDEAQMIRDMGGIVIHLDRDVPNLAVKQLSIWKRIWGFITRQNLVHASEQPIEVKAGDIEFFIGGTPQDVAKDILVTLSGKLRI